MTPRQLAPRRSRGLTLVELLVAIALGLVVLTALVALYANVSRTNNEMSKTNLLIENGRFAMQLLQEDVALGGFWGPLDTIEATAVPDPCLAQAAWPTDAAQLEAYKTNLVGIPVHAYADGSTLAGCGAGLATVLAQSDVLVVRRASTCVAGANCDGGSDTGPHIQISACRTDAPPEPAWLLESKATLDARPIKIRLKDCAAGGVGTEAPRRKMLVNVYYVANSATGVPTLMRVRMVNGAFGAPEPMVDGIEAFKVELGVDDRGSNSLPISATNPGDGNADRYVSAFAGAPCAAFDPYTCELANVVSVRLHLLARNLEPTTGHTDEKTYQLGPLNIDPADKRFKRHVFSSTVRVVNPSSRRETP
jgi:type IV pilus assembly protein PilW